MVVKFGTEEGTFGPLLRAKFHVLHVRYMLSPVRLSSVYNAGAPYSGRRNFRQYFYGI